MRALNHGPYLTLATLPSSIINDSAQEGSRFIGLPAPRCVCRQRPSSVGSLYLSCLYYNYRCEA